MCLRPQRWSCPVLQVKTFGVEMHFVTTCRAARLPWMHRGRVDQCKGGSCFRVDETIFSAEAASTKPGGLDYIQKVGHHTPWPQLTAAPLAQPQRHRSTTYRKNTGDGPDCRRRRCQPQYCDQKMAGRLLHGWPVHTICRTTMKRWPLSQYISGASRCEAEQHGRTKSI